MTEEENKAIEYFKDDINYLEEELKRPNFLGRFITIRDKECKMLKILLNLIEKLQKENRELKSNSIPKDKIRELANYFENGEKEIKFDWVVSTYPIKVEDSKWVGKMLKELLEEG